MTRPACYLCVGLFRPESVNQRGQRSAKTYPGDEQSEHLDDPDIFREESKSYPGEKHHQRQIPNNQLGIHVSLL
jgi:hypothetical protein